MNAVINLKLEAMRRLVEGQLAEAQHPASYAARLMDADEAFLSQVMKNIKGALGKKIEAIRVHRGHGVVFIDGSGEDKSDLTVEFVVSLNLTSAYDVQVVVTGDHAQRGKLDVTRAVKVGELTPDVPTKMVLEMFE